MSVTGSPSRASIGSFWCGGTDLMLERTGRAGRARLFRAAASDPAPVADLAYDPATGNLADHWERGAGAEGVDRALIASWVAAAFPHLAAWAALTSSPEYEQLQRDALADLARFRVPVADAAAALAEIEPAPELRYQLTRLELCTALHRYLSGAISACDLELWARTCFERPDAGAELDHYVVIGKVLAALSDPGASRYLSLRRPRRLLEALGLVRPRWHRRPAVLGVIIAILGATAPLLVGAPPLPLPIAVAAGFGAAHLVRFVLDRARLGRDAAIAGAGRDVLMSLPACLVVMTAGAAL
ncbi:hypothetical protein [Glycomyces sp. NPDC047010]|uniref:hypothetical protein n=1 Tax=Glycomyces sp. NPDC047010 TaxID=3155023 RepID=UPI0033FCAD23